MTEYIYESDYSNREMAREIAELKQAEKDIKGRIDYLTGRLVEAKVEAVDWVDSDDKRWYVRLHRTPTRTCDLKTLTALYPQYVSKVTKLVEDRPKLNRLIEGGIIDGDKVMKTTYSKPFPKVYEWHEGEREDGE